MKNFPICSLLYVYRFKKSTNHKIEIKNATLRHGIMNLLKAQDKSGQRKPHLTQSGTVIQTSRRNGGDGDRGTTLKLRQFWTE